MRPERERCIRSLFGDYIEKYAARDDRLTERFSENFSGYTGGGKVLVKNREEWVKITRQDFSQVPQHIRIEMVDLSLQDLSEGIVVATAFFHIHLPVPDHILSREVARLVLIFRLEGEEWKIVHSGISIPYSLVQDGEVYPIQELEQRNRELESLIAERTRELAEANRKLEVLSETDGLTGVANRRRFDRTIAQEWQRAQRAQSPLALIMIDIDLFKHFNDYYGHLAGDSCLRAIASALSQGARRAGDLIARYGGDEFAVLLPNANADDALETVRLIREAAAALALPHAETTPGIVAISFGVASIVPSSEDAPEELVQQADRALYRSKLSRHSGLLSANHD